MSLDSQELRNIFSEIQAEFFNNRNIEIHPVAGDPPSQYEVTYHIPCTVQDDQGNVSLADLHTVVIAIPFGFPHFPPSCKPKTPVFHPDFDSAAICLGSFWNRDRTLVELIHHIGDMLAGKTYSTSNAFNEAAAQWFRQNSSALPFVKTDAVPVQHHAPPLPESEEEQDGPVLDFDDNFDFDDETTTPDDLAGLAEPASDDLSPETESLLDYDPGGQEKEKHPAISTMGGQDLLEDFQFSDDIQEVASEPLPLSGTTQSRIDIDKLKHLARRRNFCQLDSELTAITADNDFPDRQELTEKTALALQEALKLYGEAEDYENQGLPNKALECFKAVETVVADYPNIRADISRVENAAEMLQEITEKNGGAAPEPSSSKRSRAKKATKDREEIEEVRTPPRPLTVTRRPTNFMPYVIVGGLLAILAPLTYFYFTLSSQLTESRQLFTECTTAFAAKDFQAAEKACSTSLATSKGIYFIHQQSVKELQQGIRNLLESEEMQQGLQGNVLFNNKYIPKSTLSAHQSLQEMLDKGKAFVESSAWDQAAANFQKALELCSQIDDFSPEERMNIEQNLNYATFRSMLTKAESQVDQGLWKDAAVTLSQLQEKLISLAPKQQVEFRDYVETLHAKSRFTTLKQQADALFSQSDWTGAVELFHEAMEAGRTLSAKENEDITDIKANIGRAELYRTINEGNSAFAQGQWDEAIGKYSKAKDILDANAALLGQQEVTQSRTKLDRIILQSAIIRDRQTADRHKSEGDGKKADLYLQKVIDTIDSSSFAKEPEFAKIATETHKAKEELKQELFIKGKEQYLVDNFLKFFMDNYPAATPETLSNPVATFEKRLGQLYLFKLQCTESGRGRPLKLIMYYTYDPGNGRWHFYSDKR